jgi:ribonuclease P/MRP protein subunit RPP40
MYLDKEAYERCGLVGKPYGSKGKRGLKPRWSKLSSLMGDPVSDGPFTVVELDLTISAMSPGKKGFERLMYACKNYLSNPVTWLFCNLTSTSMYHIQPKEDPD